MNQNFNWKRWLMVGISSFLILLLSFISVPQHFKLLSLTSLGYSDNEAEILIDKGLADKVNAYSPYLIKAIEKGSFDSKYLNLYMNVENVDHEMLFLYERLASLKGYSEEELIKLFSALNKELLIPLSVFDKVDVDTYLSECQSFASEVGFTTDFLHPYENGVDINNSNEVTTFVSRKFNLGTYEPDDLKTIDVRYAVDGMHLRGEALTAFEKMCDALEASLGTEGIYAVSSYISYTQQLSDYEDYGLEADKYLFRAGYSDAQTGLLVGVVSSANASINEFAATTAYTWLVEHAHEYGFIERYPSIKSYLTGRDGKGAYWRYVGVELASAIKQSGLCFDEYYMLYIYE